MAIRFDSNTEQAAKAFFETACPGVPWNSGDHSAENLILCAFHLYSVSWNGWNVREWKWPSAGLRGEHNFSGDEPWSILLRRAVELCREPVRA